MFVLRSLLTFKISSLHAAIIYNSMTSIMELYWDYFTNFFIITLTSLYFQIKKLCVCLCVCVEPCEHEYNCPQRPEECLGVSGTRVTGGYEPSDVNARNQK